LDFCRGRRAIVGGDVLREVAVSHIGNRRLATLGLALARWVITVADRGFLAPSLGPCHFRGERAVRTEGKPTLATVLRSVLQEVGFRAARSAAHTEAGNLVVPQKDVAIGRGLQRIDRPLRNLCHPFLLEKLATTWQPRRTELSATS